MTTSEIAQRLDAKGGKFRCKAHDDKHASGSITEASDGRTLLNCHAGCSFNAILEANGLKAADCFPEKPRNGKPQIVECYDYTDESGALLFQAVRYEPKDFKQRQPDGNGWKWNLQGVALVLFRLPEILRDVQRGLPILICEGEKDCLALVAAGFSATCNPMGAGKWRASYADTLTGADCVIIPDNDAGPKFAGQYHAAKVAESLRRKAARVRVCVLPPVLNGRVVKDASDFFNAGGTATDLIGLIDAAPEDYAPPKPEPTNAPLELASVPEAIEDVAGWVRGEIVTALTSRGDAWKQRQVICRAVVAALANIGRFYYHTEQRDFESALFFNSRSKRLERIASDAFAAWLSELIAVNRGESHFRNIFAAIQNAAITGPHTSAILPEAFWASRPGAIYLSNGDGHLVKISIAGVKLADNGEEGVLFPVGKTLAPWRLVEPQDPFDACSLFRNVHSTAPHGKTLLQLWSYSLPTNPRSKPPVALSGDVGSGKTRTAKGIAEVYGLPFIAAKVEEGNEDDFWPGLDAGGLFTLDNADTKCRWLADALAAAATDGCSQRRKKYTDSDCVILRARAWLAVTTANPTFASDAGLADRLLVVRMGRQDGETSDAALSDEIAAARDAGLSHIAHTLRVALADTLPTPGGLNARHPDFAAFAVRIGRALGIETEAVAALKAAEQDKSVFCLEHDAIAPAVLALVEAVGSFEGEAKELLDVLRERNADIPENLTPRGLGKRLSALLPHFAKVLEKAKALPGRNGNKFILHMRVCGFNEPNS